MQSSYTTPVTTVDYSSSKYSDVSVKPHSSREHIVNSHLFQAHGMYEVALHQPANSSSPQIGYLYWPSFAPFPSRWLISAHGTHANCVGVQFRLPEHTSVSFMAPQGYILRLDDVQHLQAYVSNPSLVDTHRKGTLVRDAGTSKELTLSTYTYRSCDCTDAAYHGTGATRMNICQIYQILHPGSSVAAHEVPGFLCIDHPDFLRLSSVVSALHAYWSMHQSSGDRLIIDVLTCRKTSAIQSALSYEPSLISPVAPPTAPVITAASTPVIPPQKSVKPSVPQVRTKVVFCAIL